ncbi:MAG: transmembrane domain-containing protein [Acidimicrobiia bacterium]|nr:transmembrane domain-containing protein [Acidimicrobiia bacterium]
MTCLAAFVTGSPLDVAAADETPVASSLALFDIRTGQWHLREGNLSASFYFGEPGDVPLMGDWDCDGEDTPAMFRPSNGFVYLTNRNAQSVAVNEFFYGMAGDIPLAGDWDGDGCDTFAIYRPTEGRVYLRNALGLGTADHSFYFGDPGDRPFAGDFDGDGFSTVGLYRDLTGFTYLRNTNDQGVAHLSFFYGDPADRIVAGDWNGDGSESVGIFRPSEARFYLSDYNRQGIADRQIGFGDGSWLPVAGTFHLEGPPTVDPGTASPWSDPATWPEGRVPGPGDVVTIPDGDVVLLDASPAALGGLNINGALIFDARPVTLRADWVMVRGALQIGTETAPHDAPATIVLTGDEGQDVMGMGTRVLGVLGSGTLDVHGAERSSWTHLASNASIGATSITLDDTVDWQPGERIVISSTDFDWEQAEERTLTSVSGNVVSFSEPLEHPHWGELQYFDGRILDERAEVALLDRSIQIRGEGPGIEAGFGGHTMFMPGSTVRIEHSEFTSMGQAGLLARYPLHWHHAGDVTGSYVRGASIHDNFNRCVTIHETDNLVIENSLGYNTRGHCFFLEDGSERGNELDGNLGLSTRRPDESNQLLPSDDEPATFWITNPDNVLRNNVAAGSEGTGIWYALPEHPLIENGAPSHLPIRFLPLGEFTNNTAHSNYRGIFVDNGPEPDGTTDSTNYRPRSIPTDEDSDPVIAHFDGVIAYKNRDRGIWTRGDHHLVTNAVLADNGVGASFASSETGIDGGLIVGESANLGNPHSWEETGPGGRSLPAPWDPAETIRGYDFYDGPIFAHNLHFAGFESRSQRAAGALSVLNFTDFTLDFRNEARGLSFSEDTNRVFLESRPLPTDSEDGEDGYRSAVFQDADGTTTGVSGAGVVVDNPILIDNECSFREAWGAWVCERDYQRLALSDRTSGGIGRVTITRDDGAQHTLLGSPAAGTRFHSSVLVGRSYTLSADIGWSGHMQFRTHDNPAPLYLVIDGWTTAPNLYRDWWIDERNRLESVGSVAEVLAGDGSRYYLEGTRLHLLLVPQENRDYAAIEVCSVQGCY